MEICKGFLNKMKLQPNQYFIHYCETARKLEAQIFTPAVRSKIVDDYKGKGKP